MTTRLEVLGERRALRRVGLAALELDLELARAARLMSLLGVEVRRERELARCAGARRRGRAVGTRVGRCGGVVAARGRVPRARGAAGRATGGQWRGRGVVWTAGRKKKAWACESAREGPRPRIAIGTDADVAPKGLL